MGENPLALREILLEIFTHVSGGALINCCLVTKRWNRVINDSPQLWKVLCLNKWELEEKNIEIGFTSWKEAYFLRSQLGAYRGVVEHISSALLEYKDALYLKGKSLSFLPMELFSPFFVFNIVYLELSSNQFHIVPDKIFTLTNLRTLYLDRYLIQME
jgi:hypothetical protein